MVKDIKLNNPILIDGKKRKSLKYDTEEITVEHFAKAEGLKASSLQKQSGTMMVSPVAETDYSMHLYLGFMAIIAYDETHNQSDDEGSIDIEDLKRIKGHDIKKVMEIGRNFMLKSEDDMTEDEDNTSVSTPNTSEDA